MMMMHDADNAPVLRDAIFPLFEIIIYFVSNAGFKTLSAYHWTTKHVSS